MASKLSSFFGLDSAIVCGTVAAPGLPGPSAVVRLDRSTGAPTLEVLDGEVTVIEPSPLGIVTQRSDLSTGLSFVGSQSRAVDEHYTATAGKRADRRVLMTETRFAFAARDGIRFDLVVRAAADGVAYRYALPGGLGDLTAELSAFTLPGAADAWVNVYRQDNELPYHQYTAATAPTGEYSYEALFRVGGSYALLAESDVTGRYSGARLAHATGSGTYRITWWDATVSTGGNAVDTPWRAVVVGDLATVAESTFTDDLAPASKVADTSWIRPGPVLWTWLAGGRQAGQSLELQKAYVDYAAQRGWPYVAVDAGWYFDPNNWDVLDPAWPGDSWMPQLTAYGRSKGVDILVWVHYRELTTAEQRALWFPTLEGWGVKGVKIDFMNSESQAMFDWYDHVLPETAEHHLMIDFHGSTIPKGIQRTWPHVMTLEGVGGEEKRTNTQAYLATLPYTRNVIGGMDFTPAGFHRVERPDSDAAELGLTVLYESGLQMLAGTPESYDARPFARAFLELLPSHWDDTRLLAGEPGTKAVMARRAGPLWFLAGLYVGDQQVDSVRLDLGDEGPWFVEMIASSSGVLSRGHQIVKGGSQLYVEVDANGGFAAVARRWRPGMTGILPES